MKKRPSGRFFLRRRHPRSAFRLRFRFQFEQDPWQRAIARAVPLSGRVAAIKESAGTVLSTFGGPSTAAMAQGDVDQLDTRSQQRWQRKRSAHRRQAPRCRPTRSRPASMGSSAATRRSPASRSSRTHPIDSAQHGHRGRDVAEGRPRQDGSRPQPGQPVARPRARRLRRPGADDQPGRARRRQPELAQGRPARADAARRLHPAREDHPLRPRAHPRARRACARLGARTATSSATRRSATITRAAPFAEAGKRTPVFVRFSTVAGERGSTDTARDVRGFAVKFYTDEGNWDLVGNNIPVFFIQDAMKFPDLVHAVKPEPHHEMPQAASAHDTFWDFVSLMPESTHMLMWVMSDRAIPRSYRMMQGFGVHTFRLVNADGRVALRQVPLEAASPARTRWSGTRRSKIAGADPDFHRRDLWEAIEAGAYPEWELGLQVFTEEQAERFSFDMLDATKLVPEELVPVRPVGRMVLEPQPRQLLRRDRAGRVLHRAHRARASTSATIRCCRAASSPTSTRRSRASAARTSTRSRSTRRSRRCTTTSATACTARRSRAVASPTSRTRSAAAARSRPACAGFVVVPAAGRAKTRCAASRRSSPTTTRRRACSSRARRRSRRATSSARFRFELTQGAGAGRSASACVAMLRNVVDGAGARRGRRASAWRCRRPHAARARRPADARGRRRRRRCRCWRGRATAASRRAASPSSSPTASTARRCARCTRRARRRRRGAALRRRAPRRRASGVGRPDPRRGDDGDGAVGALRRRRAPGARRRRLPRLGHAVEFVKDQYRHCKPILVLGHEECAGRAGAAAGGLAGRQRRPGPAGVHDRTMPPVPSWPPSARHRHYERETDPPRV